MAVVGVPGWIGASAVTETGQRWMAAAGTDLRITARPFLMSAMAGRSKEIAITLGGNHSFNWETLATTIRGYGSSGNAFVITITGDLVSYTTGQPCINIPSEFSNVEYIKIVNNATIYGRGGNGGGPSTSHGGKNGGVGITNGIGSKLQIQNNAAICGGGGGGGGGGDVGLGGDRRTVAGGSGGRPFGLGGSQDWPASGSKTDGNDATLTAPGARTASVNFGTNMGGAGGQVGAAGEGGIASGADSQTAYGAGSAGAAVNGSAPTWITVGTIYGSRV